jgi:hypothetical protein
MLEKRKRRSRIVMWFLVGIVVLAGILWNGAAEGRRNQQTRQLMMAIIKEDPGTVERMAASGYDLNRMYTRSSRWMEPLLDRLNPGNAEQRYADRVIEYIFDGQTPLTLAASMGGYPSTEILLKHGADANGRNKDGQTPLLVRCRILEEEYGDPVKNDEVLLKHGADVYAKDPSGKTALEIASTQKGNPIAILLRHTMDAKHP